VVAEAAHQLAGLARRMMHVDRESSARCLTCQQDLCRNVNPEPAGRSARGHARKYGHRTEARHVQVVRYAPRPDPPGA